MCCIVDCNPKNTKPEDLKWCSECVEDKNMRPIIFLDVDGVLNTPMSWGKRREQGMDEDKVKLVSDLAEKVDADVVISSAWRNHYPLIELKDMLQKRGWQDINRIIGVTPNSGDMSRRGQECRNFLNENIIGPKPKVLALDDQWVTSFIEAEIPYLQTSCSKGITEKDIEQATSHFHSTT